MATEVTIKRSRVASHINIYARLSKKAIDLKVESKRLKSLGDPKAAKIYALAAELETACQGMI